METLAEPGPPHLGGRSSALALPCHPCEEPPSLRRRRWRSSSCRRRHLRVVTTRLPGRANSPAKVGCTVSPRKHAVFDPQAKVANVGIAMYREKEREGEGDLYLSLFFSSCNTYYLGHLGHPPKNRRKTRLDPAKVTLADGGNLGWGNVPRPTHDSPSRLARSSRLDASAHRAGRRSPRGRHTRAPVTCHRRCRRRQPRGYRTCGGDTWSAAQLHPACAWAERARMPSHALEVRPRGRDARP